MANFPFMRGRNFKTVLMFEDAKVDIFSMDWSHEVLGEEHTDQVGGSDTADFDTTIDGHKVTLKGYLLDAKGLDTLLAWGELRATNTRLPKMGFGIQLGPNDGSKAIYSGSGITLGLWKLTEGGRKVATSIDMPIYMKRWKKVS